MLFKELKSSNTVNVYVCDPCVLRIAFYDAASTESSRASC